MPRRTVLHDADPQRQTDRNADEYDSNRELRGALPPQQRRECIGQPAVNEIAGDDRQQRAEYEGRVRRPTEKQHARNQVVHQMKGRGVSAERIEQHQHHGHAEKANLARPKQSAHHAEAKHRDGSKRARIDLAGVLRDVETGRSECVVPGKARRAP